ncbi:response regulator transcription factor [Methylobrevis pamukkalensis]|uniref:Response regulator protein TmoT n=1 Tax=Methylobrevis pamukkalensis TaxID=1439726 RepID=A0A1E3H5A6_9HYPH|nr:response regulator [Methylobrevis pamukkalensis]ODN71519.1 Response regulator protein TmoT [Methylobrevis pamukkalensis]
MEATVHIVDDDPAVRTALARLCRAEGLAAVEHADAAGLADATLVRRPACIVLDVRLSGENGLAVQDALRNAGSDVPVVFLTGNGTIPMTVRAMRGGAVEFLTKPVEDHVLIDAVQRAIEIDRVSVEGKRAHLALTERYASLNDRERDVMGYVIGGLMNKQIAGELGLAEITAKVHKRRVMEKMGARSLPDLVRMAEQLGIATRRHR